MAGSDLIERARAWIEADPDPETRTELEELVSAGETAELRDRMTGELEFGTAGLRGRVEAGSNRMNRAVVIRATRGLADYLVSKHGGAPESPVVVGFDARPSSRRFAEDTAGVLAAAGIRVLYFPRVTPTPLVAFACKQLEAAAAVVVTASHNPPEDNGYKVYAGNGAQIVPPMDVEIVGAISAVGPAREVPRFEEVFESPSGLVSTVPEGLFDSYWEQVERSRPAPTGSALRIVYTPIHGVGGEALAEVFARAGHSGLIPVPEQAAPDGTFPTVSFPNPEEEGALDLALELAEARDADLVIANDPDADRFAAVVPTEEGWRRLTGNDIGVLLGDYILAHADPQPRPLVVSTIVSSPMFPRLAAGYGAHFEMTLTGFKWIANAAMTLEQAGTGRFLFGYEQALGYTIGSTVRDKDGISAALVFTDLVAGLAEQEETVLDRLAQLWSRVGVWASAQHSIVRTGPTGPESIREAIESLASDPPAEIGGMTVSEVADYRAGAEDRPPWLGYQELIEVTLGESGRLLVRPSGTEPKLKIYADLVAEPGPDPHRDQRELQQSAARIALELGEGLPG